MVLSLTWTGDVQGSFRQLNDAWSHFSEGLVKLIF